LGFIKKLLSSVSSVALLLASSPGVRASVPPGGDEAARHDAGIAAGESGLVKEFVASTKRPYTEHSVELGIRRLFDSMGSDRLRQLPEFSRNLHGLGMGPENEIAAVETLLAMVDQLSGSTISDEQAGQLSGQIFDQFVAAVTVTQTAAAMAGEGTRGGGASLEPGSPGPGAQTGFGRAVQRTQLAQAGISSPEKVDQFLPEYAPEELEQFEPAAGDQITANLDGGNPFES
jgi:hypothetical protein